VAEEPRPYRPGIAAIVTSRAAGAILEQDLRAGGPRISRSETGASISRGSAFVRRRSPSPRIGLG